jgi:hypothetical protein
VRENDVTNVSDSLLKKEYVISEIWLLLALLEENYSHCVFINPIWLKCIAFGILDWQLDLIT